MVLGDPEERVGGAQAEQLLGLVGVGSNLHVMVILLEVRDLSLMTVGEH